MDTDQIPIHFLCAIPANPKPRPGLACLPGVAEFHKTINHPAYARTDDTSAVTCPACRGTNHYKAAVAKRPK